MAADPKHGKGGLEKVAGGFKAVTKRGKPLSKKPLSRATAAKQVAAVKISQALKRAR